MSKECPQRYSMHRSESRHIVIDWGENTAGLKTGVLAAGDTVASCVVVVNQAPAAVAGQSIVPTLGAVSVPGSNASSDDINGRIWSAGEATSCLVTILSNQTYGTYRLRFTATTTNGEIIDGDTIINVVAGGS